MGVQFNKKTIKIMKNILLPFILLSLLSCSKNDTSIELDYDSLVYRVDEDGIKRKIYWKGFEYGNTESEVTCILDFIEGSKVSIRVHMGENNGGSSVRENANFNNDGTIYIQTGKIYYYSFISNNRIKLKYDYPREIEFICSPMFGVYDWSNWKEPGNAKPVI